MSDENKDVDFLRKELRKISKEEEEKSKGGSKSKNKKPSSDDTSQDDDTSDKKSDELEDNENSENNEESEDEDESDKEEGEDEEDGEEDEDDEEEEGEDEEDEDDEDDEDEDDDDEEDEDEEDEDDEEDEGEDTDDASDRQDRKDLNPKRTEEGSEDDDDDDDDGDDDEKSDGLGKKLAGKAANKIRENSKVAQAGRMAKNIATAAVNTAKAVGSFLMKVVGLLINPYFWGVVLVIIVVLALISTFQVLGGNDYNKLCDSSGVGSVNISEDADDFTRQSAIASWFMSTPFEVNGGKPFNREQTMGIMGNFFQETTIVDPKRIQGGYKNWETCDNDCVAAFVGGGKAVGILQWDGSDGDPRRDNLVKLAKAEGTQWYDLDTQLKHIKQELDAEGDHTYENYMIKKSGFLETGKSIDEYTLLWSEYIERCGDCRNDQRIVSAEEFDKVFTGASAGFSSQCLGGGGVDASSLSELAKSIAYTREEKAAGKGYANGACAGGHTNCGMTFSKPEYIEAKTLAEEMSTKGADTPGFLASCDRLVATMVISTGIDVDFPWGSTDQQISYMENPSNGWERSNCNDRQPGDVFGESGHMMIYAGEVDGRETVISASLAHRSAHMSDISCVGKLYRGDEKTVQGWRKVN